jgi:hypothetical protein
MSKILIIFVLTYVTFVLSLPVPCGQTARALEIENEVLGADPCGGRAVKKNAAVENPLTSTWKASFKQTPTQNKFILTFASQMLQAR